MTAYVGAFDLDKTPEKDTRLARRARLWMRHERYNPKEIEDDIGIVRIDSLKGKCQVSSMCKFILMMVIQLCQILNWLICGRSARQF
jgi:hypothetical protein